MKLWTVLSRSCPAGQTDNGQFFLIRKESGQRSESRREKSGQIPESRQTPDTTFWENRTKTRQGQDTVSAIRRRLDDAKSTVQKV